MKEFELFLKLMPIIIELMKMAEKVFAKEKSGVEKKEAVINGVNAIYGMAEGMSTGGQKETLTTVKPLVSPTIDVLAGFMFPKVEAMH